MLEMALYEECERLANKQGASLPPPNRCYDSHNHDIKVTMLSQLGQYINSSSPTNFDAYMAEMGGLSPRELEIYVEMMSDVVQFQLAFFGERIPSLPLSDGLVALACLRKIIGLRPNCSSVLEINSGHSLLPFALKRGIPGLKRYISLEREAPLYMCMHYVNQYLFGSKFEQRVMEDVRTLYPLNSGGRESNPFADNSGVVSIQIPWWRAKEIQSNDQKFDVVVSNANILDVSPSAMTDFLGFIRGRLAPDGVLIAQGIDSGNGPHRALPDRMNLLREMHQAKFAPLLIALNKQELKDESWGFDLSPEEKNSLGLRAFAAPNAVFVTETHPYFESDYRSENYRDFYCAGQECVRQTFLGARPDLRRITRLELTKLIENKIRSVK